MKTNEHLSDPFVTRVTAEYLNLAKEARFNKLLDICLDIKMKSSDSNPDLNKKLAVHIRNNAKNLYPTDEKSTLIY
jgi:hypothetical protein